jgi:hypothetical protein
MSAFTRHVWWAHLCTPGCRADAEAAIKLEPGNVKYRVRKAAALAAMRQHR